MADAIVDHYRVLGVAADAPAEEIRRAYRTLSKQLHPDRPGGDPVRFAALSASYAVLNDPEARATYDAERALARARESRSRVDPPPAGPTPGAARPAPHVDPRPASESAAGATFARVPPSGTTSRSVPPTPSNPARPSTRTQYLRHRAVSYALAGLVGALWWPVQYLLARAFPSAHGVEHTLQAVVTRPGAAALVPLLAALALYAESRYYAMHTLRVSAAGWLRYVSIAVLAGVIWLNVYLAVRTVDLLVVVLATLAAAAVVWRARR